MIPTSGSRLVTILRAARARVMRPSQSSMKYSIRGMHSCVSSSIGPRPARPRRASSSNGPGRPRRCVPSRSTRRPALRSRAPCSLRDSTRTSRATSEPTVPDTRRSCGLLRFLMASPRRCDRRMVRILMSSETSTMWPRICSRPRLHSCTNPRCVVMVRSSTCPPCPLTMHLCLRCCDASADWSSWGGSATRSWLIVGSVCSMPACVWWPKNGCSAAYSGDLRTVEPMSQKPMVMHPPSDTALTFRRRR